MTRFTAYVLRQCLAVTVFVTLGLTSAAWLIQSLRLVELVVDHGVGMAAFVELMVLSVPQLLTLALPIGCFIGVQFTLSKLTADSELVVMRACGLSQRGLARGPLLLGAFAVAATLAVTLYLSPASKNAFKDLQFQIRNQFTADLLQDGTFNQLSDTLTVYVRARDAEGRLRGLLIQDMRDPVHPVTLTAELGMIIQVGNTPRVLMLNGTRQIWNADTHRLAVLRFERWTIDLGPYRDAPGARSLQPDERYIQDLFFPDDGDASPEWRQRLWVEGHNRLATPLYCMAFVMVALAALLTGEHNRRGQTTRIVSAYLIVAAIEALTVGLTTIADRHPVAVLLMYLTPLAPVALGWALLYRSEGQSVAALISSPSGQAAESGA